MVISLHICTSWGVSLTVLSYPFIKKIIHGWNVLDVLKGGMLVFVHVVVCVCVCLLCLCVSATLCVSMLSFLSVQNSIWASVQVQIQA